MRKESKKIVRNNLEEEEFCEIERKEKKKNIIERISKENKEKNRNKKKIVK